MASHCDHEIPPVRGFGVFHQVLDDLRADVAGGLIAERVGVTRQRQVVVNGFRHVRDFDFAERVGFDLFR